MPWPDQADRSQENQKDTNSFPREGKQEERNQGNPELQIVQNKD